MTVLAKAPDLSLTHPLVLIRHGETDWNVARRLQGHEDIPLNDRGRVQARRNGEALKAKLSMLRIDPSKLDWIASPLSRAMDTMRLIRSEVGIEADGFPTDARLIELGFGRWAGLDIHEVAAADPHGHAAREADRWNARPPGGESMADGADRVRPLLAGLRAPTVLVTHGGLIRVIHVLLGFCDAEGTRHLATPQDRFHVIDGRRVEWV